MPALAPDTCIVACVLFLSMHSPLLASVLLLSGCAWLVCHYPWEWSKYDNAVCAHEMLVGHAAMQGTCG